MMVPAEIRVLQLAGAPRERGRSHGEALRPVIGAAMGRWKETIGRETGVAADRYLDRFVEATDFVPAIERWTPDLLDEVRGIAEGAAISFRDAYAYQLIDEEWEFRRTFAGHSDALEHCSAVGIFDQEGLPPLLAQNMDLPDYYDGSQTLLRIAYPDSELEVCAFTPAGVIVTTGLNNRSLGICCNTLAQLSHARAGLPVAFVVRRVLEQETLADAVAVVRGVAHASGQNYTVGSPEGIVDLECSANQVAQFRAGATRLYHTNHPLVNDDLTRRRLVATVGAAGKGATTTPAGAVGNSEQRFAYLERALADDKQGVTVDTVRAILSTCDVPISVARHNPNGSMTLGSLIMELSAPPVLHVAPGPPAETAYSTPAL